MPALNILDQTAAPVYDCFTSTPDFTAYDVRQIRIEYEENPQNAPGAWESLQMDSPMSISFETDRPRRT